MYLIGIMAAGAVVGAFALIAILCLAWFFASIKGYLKYKNKKTWNDPKRASEELHDVWPALGGFLVCVIIAALGTWGTIDQFNDQVDCKIKGYTYQDQVCYSQLERAE